MAKATSPVPAVPETFDDAALYEVNFSRVVWDGPFNYQPRDTIRMTGAVVNRFIEQEGRDVLASAVAR